MHAFENVYCPPNGSEGAFHPSITRRFESGQEALPGLRSQRCLAKSER